MEGSLKVKIDKSGKLDLQSLERQIKSKISGYDDYKFDYKGNKVWVEARGKDTPPSHISLFVFCFFGGG